MGACCTCKENKNIKFDEEIQTKSSRNMFMPTTTKMISIPQLELDYEKSPLSESITILIKHSLKFNNINISKFSYEQLWNVSKFYLDDFTTSDYLIYDLRPNIKRTENFIKKFRKVNYTINEMKILPEYNLNMFTKYIDNKRIIVILKEESIKVCEEFIEILSGLQINVKICILTNLLSEELDHNYKPLYEIAEGKHLQHFPNILFPLKLFPHLGSDNFVFLDYIQNEDLFSYEFLNEWDLNFQNFYSLYNFLNFYKCSNIVKIFSSQNSFFKNQNPLYSNKELKIKKSDLNIECNISCLSNITTIDDIIFQKDLINEFFDSLKSEIISCKSIIIQLDPSLNKTLAKTLMLIIIWKLTDVPPSKTKSYIKESMFYIKELNDITEEEFFKYLNIIIIS
jgi:hypothetical protein